MNRLPILLCLIAATLGAAPAYATTDIFDGNPAPVSTQLTGSGIPVTVSGGQLLYRVISFIPDHDGSIYGTTSRLPGYSNPLTVTFGQPVTTVRVTLLNIAPVRIRWNNQQVSPNGIRLITFPGPLTELPLEAFNLDPQLNPTTDWDFAILSISTDQGAIDFPDLAPPLQPVGPTLVKIADGDTPRPGGGPFGGVGTPALYDGVVAFNSPGGSAGGIFTGTGGPLTLVVDTSTPIPGGTGSFSSFAAPIRVGNAMAFVGVDQQIREGVYVARDDGSVGVLADPTTPNPAGTGNLSNFAKLGFSGAVVAFEADAPEGGQALYTNQSGSLARIARESDPAPGSGGTFDRFLNPAVSDAMVAFKAFVNEEDGMGGIVSREAIYRFAAGSLEPIVDETTPIPDGDGTFTALGDAIDVAGDSVYFVGEGQAGQAGIYRFVGGSITRIVDTSTPIPGGAYAFLSFGPVAVSGSAVAFLGNGLWGQSGIYLSYDGAIRPLLKTNGPLDETHLAGGLSLNSVSYHGPHLALGAVYSGNQGRGIFRLSVDPLCGDDVVGGDEQCDDGNLDDGDGCSSTCAVEGDPCGDGDLDTGEECDDGNTENDDGCSADCQLEDFCTQMCARPEARHVAQSNMALVGTSGDDILCGDERANTLRGNRGDDVLCGFGGDDTINGNQGDDILDGGEGDDVLRGDDGDDRILGAAGKDMLYGGAGNDDLQGGVGDDTLRGGSGDDMLDGGDDADKLYGEAGGDACVNGEVVRTCEAN